MIKKRNLLVANWKMNPSTFLEAKKIFNSTRAFAKSAKNTDIVICTPSIYLAALSKLKRPKNIFLGSQNISDKDKGAFTGEISASMIKDFGVSYTIIGHSERRAMGETNELVSNKLKKAFTEGITPIVCIGEIERDKEGEYLDFIRTQIKETFEGIQKKDLLGTFVAYEPVWAIGKSFRESMNATDVHETTLVIKKIFTEIFGKDIANSIRILYGGSVDAENAGDILKHGNVSGLLVGGASLVPEKFSKIIDCFE